MEKYQTIFYDYIKSIPLFKKIYSDLDSNNCTKEEAEDYFNMLYNDYLNFFIYNNADLSISDNCDSDLVENWKGLIKKIIEMRFEDYDKNFRNDLLFLKLSRYILWIESNSKYIILILLIYKKLSFIQLLNDKIEKSIEKKEIKYEYGTNRSPLESKIVNECFFIYNEAMIKLILRETNLFNKIGDNLLGFTNTIKEIYHYSSQLNYELNLFFKRITKFENIHRYRKNFQPNRGI